MLHLHFSLPGPHCLTSSVPLYGRHKIVGFSVQQRAFLGGPVRTWPVFSKYVLLHLGCSLVIHPYSIHTPQSSQHSLLLLASPCPSMKDSAFDLLSWLLPAPACKDTAFDLLSWPVRVKEKGSLFPLSSDSSGFSHCISSLLMFVILPHLKKGTKIKHWHKH